jgi:hypothetical protein
MTIKTLHYNRIRLETQVTVSRCTVVWGSECEHAREVAYVFPLGTSCHGWQTVTTVITGDSDTTVE